MYSNSRIPIYVVRPVTSAIPSVPSPMINPIRNARVNAMMNAYKSYLSMSILLEMCTEVLSPVHLFILLVHIVIP